MASTTEKATLNKVSDYLEGSVITCMCSYITAFSSLLSIPACVGNLIRLYCVVSDSIVLEPDQTVLYCIVFLQLIQSSSAVTYQRRLDSA